MKMRGIILAAGSSKRMGINKLSMEFNEKTILETVIDNAKASYLDEIVLVYGKYETAVKIQKIYNPNYEKGMSTSIIAGMSDFEGDAVMILLGDMPYISTNIINSLYKDYASSCKNITVPVKGGKKGNPVVIGKKYFNDILNNSGDKGARDIIKKNTEDVKYLDVSEDGIFIDIDDIKKYNEITSNKS